MSDALKGFLIWHYSKIKVVKCIPGTDVSSSLTKKKKVLIKFAGTLLHLLVVGFVAFRVQRRTGNVYTRRSGVDVAQLFTDVTYECS